MRVGYEAKEWLELMKDYNLVKQWADLHLKIIEFTSCVLTTWVVELLLIGSIEMTQFEDLELVRI